MSGEQRSEDVASSEPYSILWDLSVRCFHWSLVTAVCGAWLTIELGMTTAHLVCGVVVLVLVAFRVTWGIVGSSTARFVSFVVGPAKTISYLRVSLGESHQYHGGHNPAGAYMVVFMLSILALQGLLGLFSNNDLGFAGPLSDLVAKADSDRAAIAHSWLFDIVQAMVWLHLLAVFYYVLVKRDNLLVAMISGVKHRNTLPENYQFVPARRYLAIFVWLLCTVIVIYLIFFSGDF